MELDVRDFVCLVAGVFLGIFVAFAAMYKDTKTDTDKEIIESVCDYIYENEAKEVYLKYCD
ncbi:hypothetical protein [Turicibacter sanguinis]|uniref:hypothetical protein n=1 Tax=Turicibacter sanguinis TaxID=154288 RepID=UPI0018AC0338|nr:hypothetical protein [Turicibacter sanguinis]MDB8567742.1 hypothetical protein [Turicibacter sanguinis]MDB8570488.1 hypothetical protein [Turicibacter sanguinis]MDB8573248.1 hypothetical protein [Turicibacter sanguinis]MDB8581940.1 hypothetical protein [Turicibacter sanguinis]